MTMEQHHDPNWLREILDLAVKAFNNSADIELLMDEKSDDGESHGSVGERAIAHRLAVHLELVLQSRGYPRNDVVIATDCEYNRHRGAIKRQHIKADLKNRVEAANRRLQEDPNQEGWYFFSVYPDVIVHERGDDRNNLIVVEMKRASNSVADDYDYLKLQLFTGQGYEYGYGYCLGASVVALDQDEPEKRELVIAAWFVNGERVP